jgi:FixJ family two-component response regulator
MIRNQVEVYVVDDDEAVRNSLCWLIESANHSVIGCSSAEELLDDFSPQGPSCVVTDVRMPGMGGLGLLSEIVSSDRLVPVVLITGHGDIQMAVKAMKDGAFDFVEKPFEGKDLLGVIERAMKESYRRHAERSKDRDLWDRFDKLTPRELQVLDLIVSGQPNRVVAEKLQIGIKTVEAHRAHIMEKMNAGSFANLVTRVVNARAILGADEAH